MSVPGRDDPDERTVVERHDPLLGQVVGSRFRILEKIAAGGFGAIYRAQHLESGHEVAVKVLHAALASDPNVIARFRREGATLSNLRAPHTVTTYELGEAPDGMLYIVMELLRGGSLHERLRAHGAMPWRDALTIARAICVSLAEAHGLGIIHRDLKPANIHLEPRAGGMDFVKVLDFGIAKIRRGTGIDDGSELTSAGQMIGTLDYMSPEQILGGVCDGRSDLFTLGIVMYEMISGRRPFSDSTTPTSMLAALLTQTPPQLSSWVPVSPRLDLLVMRCLHREAADRFATVEELMAAIDDLLGVGADDSATHLFDLGSVPPLQLDDEATVLAGERYLPGPRPGPVNTLESTVPPAPVHRDSSRRPRQPTPAPIARPPAPVHRDSSRRPRQPTPPPIARTPTPVEQVPVDTSGWQVRRAGARGTDPALDPSAWQAYSTAAASPRPGQPAASPQPAYPPHDRGSQPYLPAVAPPPGQERISGPVTAQPTYDASKDAAVGRVVWIVALVIMALLGFGIYTIIR